MDPVEQSIPRRDGPEALCRERRMARSRRSTVTAACILVAAGLLAYGNTFSAPFVFDGTHYIEQNPSLRRLWPLWAPMIDAMRPFGWWTFALNYALGGTNVVGYHAVNLAIHLAAGLALFGIVRRTLSRGALAARFAPAASGLGLAVALLWLVHPLQTQSVTYVYQRFESQMGLFFLLTLYGFIRAQDSARPAAWYAVAVGCCLLAVTSKEVAAVAPLLVLWYDRVFVAASWRDLWQRRRGLYAALAATWAVLAAILFGQAGKFGEAGVLVGDGITAVQYAAGQPGVIAHYLRLSVWPVGLCLDYAWPPPVAAAQILPPLGLVAALLGIGVWSVFRRAEWSFLVAWFFLILAPTSSVVPIADLAFEHRMYLPLAAVVTGGVIGAYLAGGWLAAGRRPDGARRDRAPEWMGVALVAAIAAILAGLTFRRNLDYLSAATIWADTVRKSPLNFRAHYNLGLALADAGQVDEAVAHYRRAVEIKPDYAPARNNLGLALAGRGRLDEAIVHYRKALDAKPTDADAHNNLGAALAGRGEIDEAVVHYRRALEIKPDHGMAHYNLGLALVRRGQLDEAVAHYRKAVELQPSYAPAHYDLGVALALRGQADEAVTEYRKALEVDPGYAPAHYNLALILAGRGEIDGAIPHFRQAVEIKPDNALARNNLGSALLARGDIDEAIVQYRRAVELEPEYATAHYNLGLALARRGRLDEASAHYRRAVEIQPDLAGARNPGSPLSLENRGEVPRSSTKPASQP